MRSELRITLPGPESSADAERAAIIFHRLIEILTRFDRAHGTPSGTRDTKWRLSTLELGSVSIGLTVDEPRDGLTVEEAERDFARLVLGFAEVEAGGGPPPEWPRDAIKPAIDLTRRLGSTPEHGMMLGLAKPGEVGKGLVVVTRRAADNLNAWRQRRQESIGSLIGHLDGVTSHEQRHEARLWLEHPKVTVKVSFSPDQFDEHIRPHLRRRVMVIGRIERDEFGTPLTIRMRPPIQPLPGRSELPPLTHFAGSDPDFTGGVGAAEHVRRIRDSA